YDFTNLSEYQFTWALLENGKEKATGSLATLNIAPYETKKVKIDLPKLENQQAEYHLNIYALHKNKTDLLPLNHVVAYEQFPLTAVTTPESLLVTKDKIFITPIDDTSVTIFNDNFELKLDAAKGKITVLDYGNGNILVNAIAPNFWRPVTDNDYGAKSPEKLKVWKDATKNQSLIEVKLLGNSKELLITKKSKVKGSLRIQTKFKLPAVKGYATVEYTIHSSGEITVTNRLSEVGDDVPYLPRFGNNLILKNEYQNVAWFGRGPHENYNDRNTSALVGAYQFKVDDLYFPYIRPQENGYKTDVRWVTFTNTQGKGVKIEGNQLLGFSTHHQYNVDFDAGDEKQQRHTTDIIKRDFVNINVDYKQTGIGGDNSWSERALAHKEFRVMPGDLEYSYTIKPIK
ncbi:beta-galactosidase small subunit family protein, partial [Maribacter dokdonensis]